MEDSEGNSKGNLRYNNAGEDLSAFKIEKYPTEHQKKKKKVEFLKQVPLYSFNIFQLSLHLTSFCIRFRGTAERLEDRVLGSGVPLTASSTHGARSGAVTISQTPFPAL